MPANDQEDQYFRRQVKPFAISLIIVATGLSCLAAIYAIQSLLRAYDRLHAEGLSNAAVGDSVMTLLLVAAVLAGWKTVSNGVRMYAASVAPSGDRKRALDPLTGYRRSERIGSPTLRFATAVLPVFFSVQFIAGTLAIYQKLVPIDAAVLPHYGSMIFLGLAFISYSSRREDSDLSPADGDQLQAAVSQKSTLLGFGLRLAGIWAGLLGLLMVVDAFVLTTRVSDAVGVWRVLCLAFPLVFVYFGFMVLGAGKNLLRFSRRHLTRVIQSPSDLDGETFVLYLRTFRSDKLQAGFERGGQTRVFGHPLASGRSEEEQVAAAFRRVGPMVAVGRPGESLPYAGAIRMYLPKENWQEPVRQLMIRARMVVIVLGPAPGTVWEVGEALRILAPERLALLVPAQAENYRPFQLANLQADGVPVTLPPHPGVGRTDSQLQAVITFTSDWKAMLGTFDESPFRLSSYRNLMLSALRFQLRPAFTRLAEFEQRQSP